MESKSYHNKYFGLYCASCLVVMMWADKKVSAKEIAFALNLAKENPEIDKKDIQSLNHFYEKFPEMIEKILYDAADPLPPKDRKVGLKMGFDLANADGDFSVAEKSKLKEISKGVGLSDEDFEKLLKEILI